MLLEDLLLVVVIGIVGLLFGWQILRLLRTASRRRRDPLAEANERLRIAKLEAEAARVNREVERIYDTLYAETSTEKDAAAGARVATGEESAGRQEREERQAVEPPFEKGKRHGQG